MPLVITQHRSTANPTIVCDWCHEPIATGTGGNYQWRNVPEGESSPMVFTHKRCCRAFEAAQGGHWCAIGLDWLLPFLANNLEVDVKQTLATIRAYNRY